MWERKKREEVNNRLCDSYSVYGKIYDNRFSKSYETDLYQVYSSLCSFNIFNAFFDAISQISKQNGFLVNDKFK